MAGNYTSNVHSECIHFLYRLPTIGGGRCCMYLSARSSGLLEMRRESHRRTCWSSRLVVIVVAPRDNVLHKAEGGFLSGGRRPLLGVGWFNDSTGQINDLSRGSEVGAIDNTVLHYTTIVLPRNERCARLVSEQRARHKHDSA